MSSSSVLAGRRSETRSSFRSSSALSVTARSTASAELNPPVFLFPPAVDRGGVGNIQEQAFDWFACTREQRHAPHGEVSKTQCSVTQENSVHEMQLGEVVSFFTTET